MPTLAHALREPIALPPNRAPRFYRGGRLLGAFRADPGPADDDRPEDWVGSATRAWTPPGEPPSTLGPSVVEVAGERLTMEELLAREPVALVGAIQVARIGPSLGLLVKLLDAAERLPVHCHPTREAAGRLLGSRFGKTEAWIILGTREGADPHVWAGFRAAVPSVLLRTWIEKQRTDDLLAAMAPYPVREGDAFLIPGGTPHAIGAGVFLLELQEPTDYSIVAETRGYPIDRTDASLRLGWDAAVGFFDTDAARDLRQGSTRLEAGITRLLGPGADPYFRAVHVTVDGERPMPDGSSFAVAVVLAGTGEARGDRSTLPLRRGVTFAVPAAAAPHTRLSGAGLRVIVCMPPEEFAGS